MLKHAIFLAGLFAAAPAAHAGYVEISWGKDGKFSHNGTVNPGSVTEVCGKLEAGENIGWRFDSSARMDFNIHYHTKNEAIYPSKLDDVASGSGILGAASGQAYCWMWENKGAAPSALRLELERKP